MGAGGTTVLTVAGTGWVVEVDLVEGRLSCPGCGGRLTGWGHARVRQVRSGSGWWWVRPRRARCRGRCGATHVLLPVVCLLRRMYSAEIIMSALLVRAAGGAGWRVVAALAGVPGTTARDWLRRFASRAEEVRVFFTRAAVVTGIDLPAAAPTGSPVGDAVAAVGLLVAGVRQRFTGRGAGWVGAVVSPVSVTAWQVACAASGSRLLASGWPPSSAGAWFGSWVGSSSAW